MKTLLILLALAVSAEATPIPATYYDMDFYIEDSVYIPPGGTGVLQAAILNTGTADIQFNSTGVGWNWGAPGLSIGSGGVTSWRYEPYTTGRDYAALSGLIINPGQFFVFDLIEFTFDHSFSTRRYLGSTRTYSVFGFGKPTYAGYITDSYGVEVYAGYPEEAGLMNKIELHNFKRCAPTPNAPVPEPATALLFGIGLASLCVVNFKKKR